MPDEIERYGLAAATVLAHIKYRCESEGPGRFEAEGYRWWRVSYADMGAEIGVTAKVVIGALVKLGDAVVAKNFAPYGDRTLAYRVAAETASDMPFDRTVKCDMPFDHTGNSICPNGQMGVTVRSNAPLIETLEKGGEARARKARDAHPPTPEQSANSNGDDPEPPRFCPRHPIGTSEKCRDCGSFRVLHEAWKEREPVRKRKEHQARAAAIKACRRCDEYGQIDLGDGVVNCNHTADMDRYNTA
ncbi:hypothetical protein [Mycobacterium szulgai]|uniref:hypothetical protein n=1 Tax=Mycobacterium szulgai TaxID=1787 RepID=UPI0021F2F839|nr:hypothetical protein [Mycobacterium szulgai]MCV7076710.1 hypothetical protein [Mycobacterium szulgai]